MSLELLSIDPYNKVVSIPVTVTFTYNRPVKFNSNATMPNFELNLISGKGYDLRESDRINYPYSDSILDFTTDSTYLNLQINNNIVTFNIPVHGSAANYLALVSNTTYEVLFNNEIFIDAEDDSIGTNNINGRFQFTTLPDNINISSVTINSNNSISIPLPNTLLPGNTYSISSSSFSLISDSNSVKLPSYTFTVQE